MIKEEKDKRIILFYPGSFCPIQKGNIEILKKTKEKLEELGFIIEKSFLLPFHNKSLNQNKKDIFTFEERKQMYEISLKNENDNLIEICSDLLNNDNNKGVLNTIFGVLDFYKKKFKVNKAIVIIKERYFRFYKIDKSLVFIPSSEEKLRSNFIYFNWEKFKIPTEKIQKMIFQKDEKILDFVEKQVLDYIIQKNINFSNIFAPDKKFDFFISNFIIFSFK